ncbi:MAG: hypothetical protein JSW00_12650 [Thermoplasmata archaeon]|nr:MAG: hypothetical protein JSW00_12650 [Thermoplasmata archaeon]
MPCQVCGNKSGFYPLCNECFDLRDKGDVAKCNNCGIWFKKEKSEHTFCYDCWLKGQITQKAISAKGPPGKYPMAQKEFRERFPTLIVTEDGHRVRSRGELIIDNWLYHQSIVHAYERRVPIEEELYCDFFIPMGQCYIEYWGLEEDAYKERKKVKKDLYSRHSKKLIELYDKDINKIDDVMPKKLLKFIPRHFSFE